jgi:hypothetical protein
MNLLQIKQAVRSLSHKQLSKLDDWLHEVIQKAEESAQAAQPQSRKQIVEERRVDSQTYRLEMVRCGKEKCKCSQGKLHGPYWYSYSRIEGKVKSQYIGKNLPKEIQNNSSS